MIQQISPDEGVADVLTSLFADRLALLAGAGLSMAAPSALPSAAALAAHAKAVYDATFVPPNAPLPQDIEAQAEYFFQRGELSTLYLRTLVEYDAFAGPPNDGHFAIADLLLTGGIQTAVTTNIDVLVETAGVMLCGQIGVAIDATGAVQLPPTTAPLLKIHGCRVIDMPNTVWAPGQIGAEPVASRIASSAAWLNVRLADRDLLVVGYWTDWDYLNSVLASTLGAVNPSRVTIVDLADSATLQGKAPDLYALGNRASTSFRHVRISGAEFLKRLRTEFSRAFVRRILHAGAAEYLALTGHPANPAWAEPPTLDNDSLWLMRRDLEGQTPGRPSKERIPSAGPLLGLTLVQLQARGATADSSQWILNGTRIRILRADNKALHRVEAQFERDTAPVIAPNLVVAVGAESLSLPTNVARAGTTPTITRGSPSRWLTRHDAVQELGL